MLALAGLEGERPASGCFRPGARGTLLVSAWASGVCGQYRIRRMVTVRIGSNGGEIWPRC